MVEDVEDEKSCWGIEESPRADFADESKLSWMEEAGLVAAVAC